jgi:predicted ribosome quality control (RQC) complex YloA/Tae2 family protein
VSLNWKEIDRLLQEIPLAGSRIQQVSAPDARSLVFDLYTRGGGCRLYVCLANPHCRLHLLARDRKKEKDPQAEEGEAPPGRPVPAPPGGRPPDRPAGGPPRFAAFLRAHVRNGRILEAGQVGRERIVRLVVQRGDEQRILWIRLWANAANLIVTDGDYRILDAFHRRPKRGEVTGAAFNPEEKLRERMERYPPEDSYTVRDLPGPGSFNERIEAWYSGLEAREAGESLRRGLLQRLEIRENGLLSSLEGLEQRRQEYAQYERFKELGDLILTHLHTLRKGDRWLLASSQRDDAIGSSAQRAELQPEKMQIELDPRLTPAQNAERCYERYRKARAGLRALEEQIGAQARALERVRVERRAVAGEEDPARLRELARPAFPAQRGSGRRPPAGKEAPPGLSYESGGFSILVGRTAAENDALLRRFVRGNDWWFHARDYPGGYVFVRASSGKSVPLETMLDAGNLAVFYSKGRQSGRGNVYYTRVKYLRRAKEGKAGLVIPTQEKNLFIRLDAERLRRLMDPPAPS